jgi:hypothetical protein
VRGRGSNGAGVEAGGEECDVVVDGGGRQVDEQAVAQLVQGRGGLFEEVGEFGESFVDVAAAGLDEPVGVQDEDAAGLEGDIGGGEGGAADAEWDTGWHVEEAGGAVG